MVLHVVSVGGSLIAPELGKIDTDYLFKLKQFVYNKIDQDRFILVAGGGKTASLYIGAAAEVGNIDDEERDWLGIGCTEINAKLLRSIFKEYAHPKIYGNFDKKIPDFQESILIGAGWKPGWSTDYIAVLFAEHYKSKSVINLSNIDCVYSSDPKYNPSAEKLEGRISWARFRKIVGDKWIPRMNAPFDPIASKKAHELGLSVAILNGYNLENLEKYLKGESEIKGTIIE
jgi:uridylate kinase